MAPEPDDRWPFWLGAILAAAGFILTVVHFEAGLWWILLAPAVLAPLVQIFWAAGVRHGRSR
jgi:hypothetical protein